jgi:hypothetical protein
VIAAPVQRGIDAERRKRTHSRQLKALGYTVTVKPAAWPDPLRARRRWLRRTLPPGL